MLKEIINAINEDVTLKLVIDIQGDEVTMMVNLVPKADDSALKLPPVIISGNAEECTSDFLSFISSESVVEITKTASSVKAFEEATKKATEENKIAKELKDKVEKLIDNSKKALEDKDLKAIEKVRDEILTLDPNPKGKKWNDFNKTATELLKKVDNQISILDQIATEEKGGELDADIIATGKDHRSIEYGISQERQEIIEEEYINKLEQHGNTSALENF